MDERLIAPCGMNCSLCIAYQFRKKDLNKKGFHKTYCEGCIPRGKNCTHMGDKCELLGKGKVRFCFECSKYPCSMLKNLDKRYRTKYHMSMIENLDFIKNSGLAAFLKKEEDKWKCDKCGSLLCCHNGLCMECEMDQLKENKKYSWDREEKMTPLSLDIEEYGRQLRKGQIQRAYRGIISFMTFLKKHIDDSKLSYVTGAVYQGYLDMSYIAATPMELKTKNLKVAIVYLHEENRFVFWLTGVNKKVQMEYLDVFKNKDIGELQLSRGGPGVDSIVEMPMKKKPDFDEFESLAREIEEQLVAFCNKILDILR